MEDVRKKITPIIAMIIDFVIYPLLLGELNQCEG
jgi:hypothetical protein